MAITLIQTSRLLRNLGFAFLFVLALSFSNTDRQVEVYTQFSEFEHWLHKDNDTTYVINFWATWCSPCIKELPYFDSLALRYKNEKLKVLLVSMDFENKVEKTVKPFLEKRNVQSQVVVLDDPEQYRWIPKINKSWRGAIPATYIYRRKKNTFFAHSITLHELEKEVRPFIK